MFVSNISMYILLSSLLDGFFLSANAVVKRSDDTSILEVVVNRLSTDLQTLQATVTALSAKVDENTHRSEPHVGFTVGLTTSVLSNINAGVTIKFDNLIYNGGNGYNPADGHFVAPVSGVYVFYFKTEVIHGKYVMLELYREGHSIAHIYAGTDNQYDTSGDLEVMQLQKGERVWVVKTGGTAGFLRGQHGTRFSGFLLYPSD